MGRHVEQSTRPNFYDANVLARKQAYVYRSANDYCPFILRNKGANRMKPRVRILDPQFKYRDSSRTDVRKTWAKARERALLEKKVIPITQRKEAK